MFKDKFKSILILITKFLNKKTTSIIETLVNENIADNGDDLNIKGSYIFAKKVIINIPNSEPLILDRVYISNETIKIAGTEYISLEMNSKKSGSHESFCINREAIVLIEK
ncbi:hypothetical protein [Clostridium beijerinckii]|uniref:Uncharacterized protein n=1 Tax=Clostridium beijerinckii TaxID=1520 RepID=A0AAE5H1N3_CLOBE|nr:hypothetical protein [Clostridium beijerinckii]ALB44600.1 hypothetical protein X276_04530 [Clostridium beijerinckii NRRL B-598]NSB13039.1 hypothetical protein [Clostridium beijerinckii]OOM22141.1 hypothetical protein CLOBE_44800 [Clostridium beijerinckii]